MRSSTWAYPLANVAHLFGLALFAGGIIAVDLRIMGLWRRLPVKPMSDALTPFAMAGLAIFAISGMAMFSADAVTLAKSDIFFVKLGLVALALANALAFRKLSRGKLHQWNSETPHWAQASVVASLFLWSAAIVCGRMVAYQ